VSDSLSGLRDHLGYWLRRLSDEVHLSFERRLAEHGVTVAQWNVLVSLYRNESDTVGGISRFVELDVAAVSRLVDRLVEKGLVVRLSDPSSRRRIPLELTRKARKLVPVLIDLADENDETYFGALTKQQRFELVDLLKRLTINNKQEKDAS
jgi:DNA-binding MarR family transcriptional regulator